MDRAQHSRFLDYLERFTYFGRGGAVRMSREEFVRADDEFCRLLSLEVRTPEDQEALAALRVALFRD